MRIIEKTAEMAALVSPKPVVLVPTMGALHEGHAALVREARRLAGPRGTVVVSIFVNPTQFGPGEDYQRYPRSLQADCETCDQVGADIVFHPSATEMYHDDASVTISETSLSKLLCGASRPGHFAGVCTVVAKLFNLTHPDLAVFGKKDFQQLAIIRRMVRDLNMGVEIRGLETVREADGLAMSSRNAYLSKAEREQAPAIRRALLAADISLDRDPLINGIASQLAEEAPLGRIDYLELVDGETLEPIARVASRPALVAAAVFFGKTRLIDNLNLEISS